MSLKKQAAKLDDHGRHGDTLVAHINPKEALVLALLGGAATRNPKTGLLEFYDGADGVNDGMGTGSVGTDTPGGTIGGTPSDGWGGYDAAGPAASVDIATDPWEANAGGVVGPKAGPSYAEDRGFFGAIGDNLRANFQDMATRPGEAVTNAILGAAIPGYSVVNAAISTLAPGNTLAGFAMDAAKGGVPSSHMGTDETPGTTTGPSPSDPNGQNDSRGGNGDGGPLSNSAGSRSPLAAALAGESGIADPWANMGRRKTFGSLVTSLSPYGRQYVTPWAYR